jgi:hypothetical protein
VLNCDRSCLDVMKKWFTPASLNRRIQASASQFFAKKPSVWPATRFFVPSMKSSYTASPQGV